MQGGTLAVRFSDRWPGWRHLVPARVESQRPREQPSNVASNRSPLLLTRLVRGRFLLAFDLVGIAVAAYLALALRLDRFTGPIWVPAAPFAIVLLLAVRTVANIRLGLYSRRWRFASVPDLERIAISVLLGSIASALLFYGSFLVSGKSWGEFSLVVLGHRSVPQRGHHWRGTVRDPFGLPPHQWLHEQVARQRAASPAVWRRTNRCQRCAVRRTRSTGRLLPCWVP